MTKVDPQFVLVRNEATGEIMKMQATDMVQSGWQVFKVTASAGSPVVIDVTYSVTGIDLSTYQTTYVYRNGAKLVAGIDYDIDGSNIVLKPNACLCFSKALIQQGIFITYNI